MNPLFASPKSRAKAAKRRASAPAKSPRPLEGRFKLEAFEPRLMLDAQPTAVLASGVLTITGTDNADSILITRGGSSATGEIVKVKDLKTNIEQTFGTSTAGVTSIVAQGK